MFGLGSLGEQETLATIPFLPAQVSCCEQGRLGGGFLQFVSHPSLLSLAGFNATCFNIHSLLRAYCTGCAKVWEKLNETLQSGFAWHRTRASILFEPIGLEQ